MMGVPYECLLVYICLLNVIIPVYGALDLEERDNCSLLSGQKGICTRVNKCADAADLLSRGANPEICGFKGPLPIVCCPDNEESPVHFRQITSNEIVFQEMRKNTDVDGDYCTLADGRKGICKYVEFCTYATTILKAGGKPQICEFDSIGVMVCCPDTPMAKLRISDEKCREFYPYPYYPILIPGGKPAAVAEFKHMALVGYGRQENDIQWLCGGSLVSLQFVLTAAHCMKAGQNSPARWIRLGDLDISTNADGTVYQQIRIKRIIPHPEYKSPSKYHDIALLELETPAKWTEFVSPACLDSKRSHEENKMIATGWGKTGFIGEYSNHLLKTNLDVVPVHQCRESYKTIKRSELPNGIDDELQICAGGGPIYDTCQGDSGGPLQVISKNKTLVKVYVIVGVTSFGKACGISPSPGVFTRVYSHLSWLEQIIWPFG